LVMTGLFDFVGSCELDRIADHGMVPEKLLIMLWIIVLLSLISSLCSSTLV